MAKVEKNIIIQGLSGSLGDELVVLAGPAGRMIIFSKPCSDERYINAEQQAARKRFVEAATYAKVARENPLYASNKTGITQTIYNVALVEWFHSPEIVTVDLESWTGKSGEKVRARTRDNVQVGEVYFLIAQEDGAFVEAGRGTPVKDSLWWEYRTTVEHPGGVAKMLVSVQALPGLSMDQTDEKGTEQ